MYRRIRGTSIFPHLMLRAKAAKYKRGEVALRGKAISNARSGDRA
jgi:hypothetical protein